MPDPQSLWTPVDEPSAAPRGWTPVEEPSAGPSQPTQDSALSRLGTEFWQRANPLEWAKGLYHAAQGANALDIVKADPAFLTQAQDEWSKGNHLTAARKVLSYLSMGLGHDLDAQAEMMDKGDVAGGVGAMAGTAASFLAPEAIAKTALAAKGAVASATRMTPANPAIADAVRFGQDAGVPMDAATATDNAAIRGMQHIADRSLGGAQVAGKAAQAQAEGLASIGQQLAAKGYRSPVSAEAAGQGVRDALEAKAADFGSKADVEYGKLRAIEAKRPIPVDLTNAKAAIEPMYRTLAVGADIAPLQGAKAAAARAMARILEGPDTAMASEVDSALSDLKALQRSASGTPGAAAANQAVDQVHAALHQAVTKAGPDALSALREGRAATTAKYAVQDVYDAIQREPVKAFRQGVSPDDSAIQQLRDVAKYAPTEMPKIGRAFLDRFLDKATADGGFAHADKLSADWQKLGPETKQLLFNDPAHVRDLDRFFLLAKQVAKNANPSGTAHAAAIAAQGGQMLWSLFHGDIAGLGEGAGSVAASASMASFLHSPAGVRLLTEGLTLPPSAIAQAKWLERARKFATAQGAAVLAPRQAPVPAGSMQ